MKSDQISVIKPIEMGGHVARMGIKNLGNILVQNLNELEDYRNKRGNIKNNIT